MRTRRGHNFRICAMFAIIIITIGLPAVLHSAGPSGSLNAVLKLPAGAVGLELIPDGDSPRGPESFYVENDRIYLLDSVNRCLLVYDGDRLEARLNLDFMEYPSHVYAARGVIYVLDAGDVLYAMTGGGKIIDRLPLDTRTDPRNPLWIYDLRVNENGDPVIITENYCELELPWDAAKLHDVKTARQKTMKHVSDRRGRGYAGRFTDETNGELFSLDGSNAIEVKSLLGGLGSFYLAGIDRLDNFYVLTEELKPDTAKIEVRTSVRRYDVYGRLTGLCLLPATTPWPSDGIDVKEDGDVYVLLPGVEGTIVARLGFGEVNEDIVLELQKQALTAADASAPASVAALITPSTAQTTLTRVQVRDRALQMANNAWTWRRRYLKTNTGLTYAQAGAAMPSQFNASANDPNADNVACVGIPYCWGGWDSFWTHSDGAPWTDWPNALSYYSTPDTPQYCNTGPLAGNVYCDGYYKACTAGIDCSGFVSAACDLDFQSKPNVGMIYNQLNHINCVVGHQTGTDGGFRYFSGIQPMDAMCALGSHVLFYYGRLLDGNGFITIESTTSTSSGGIQGAKVYRRSWAALSGYLVASSWDKQTGDDLDQPYTVENTLSVIYGQSVYYRITNDSAKNLTYTITLKADSGNPDLFLYNNKYQLLQKAVEVGSDTITYTCEAHKTYYVKVYCTSLDGAAYKISWHPLDLIFLIDTTGSMADDIAGVKAAAIQIVNALENETPGYRVAIADYRDFPVSPYGGGGDYPYHPVLAFSQTKATIISGIQSLSLGWGDDWRESVYSGLVRAINTEGLGAWRDGATKIVIPIGDAPPHDPEPFTGYTASSVQAAAEAVDPAVICPIVVGGDPVTYRYFADLAARTGGQVFTAANPSEVVAAILDIIAKIGQGEIGPPPPPPPSSVQALREQILWLMELLAGAEIPAGVKNALQTKLANTLPHIDKALAAESAGESGRVRQTLQPCLGMLKAFINQVEAQYDKKVSQPDAGVFIERAQAIIAGIEEI